MPKLVYRQFDEGDGGGEGDTGGAGDDTAAKLKEFRDNNIKLLKEVDDLKGRLTAFDGVDPEKFKSILEQQEQLERDELIKKGDVDTLIARERESLEKSLGARLDAVQAENAELKGVIVKTKVTDELRKAATGAKVKAEAVDDLVDLAGREWVLDNGTAIRKAGGEPVLSKERPGEYQSMNEYFAELATVKPFYYESSAGGGGQQQQGGGGGSAKVLRNPTPSQLGQHAEAISKGEMVVQYD